MKRIIAGPNPVEEALKSGASAINTVMVLSGLTQKTAAKIFALCKRHNVNTETVEKSQLDTLAPELNHQGVIAIAGEFPYSSLPDLIPDDPDSPSLLVVLDQVQDPGNLGAIVRSAHSLGANGIAITKNRSAPMTGGAVRASAGASELIPICRVVNLAEAMETLKGAGYTLFGAAAEADVSLDDVDWPTRSALVMGNEGKGLRQLTRKNCDQLFSIPMPGAFESLNVSAAAAITLYQVSRARARRQDR